MQVSDIQTKRAKNLSARQYLYSGIGAIGLLLLLLLLLTIFRQVSSDFLVSSSIVVTSIFCGLCLLSICPHIFNIRTLRLPGIFIISYIALILFPIPFVYVNVPADPIRIRFVIATSAGFLSTLIGIIICYFSFPIRQFEIQDWLKKVPQMSKSLPFFVVILLGVCLGLLFLYIKQVGSLPLFSAMDSTQAAQLTQAREEALKLIPGRIRYVYAGLRNWFFPYVMVLSFVIAWEMKRKRFWVLTMIAFIGNMIMSAATLEKSPVGASLLMLSIAWILLHHYNLSWKTLIPMGVFVLIFPVFVVAATSQFQIELVLIFKALARRIFYVPSEILYYYFQYFPETEPFLLGRTLPYVSKMFINGPFPITYIICMRARPDSLASCSANAGYIGNLWADFGWFGVIGGGFLLGFVLQLLQTLIIRMGKSAPVITMQAMLSYMVIMLSSVSFPDFLESTGAFYVTLLTLILLLVISTIRKPKIRILK